MKKVAFCSFGILLSSSALFAEPTGEAPRKLGDFEKFESPSIRWTSPEKADVIPHGGPPSSNVIFLNPCFNGGCRLTPGNESSIKNKSSIIDRTVEISEFRWGQESWDQVVECVQKVYAPFNVVVTDVDPGNAPHFEAIVAGYPEEADMQGAAGVSPFYCGIINNAITYSFANIMSSVDEICWTVAQETAHAYGLEHEWLCSDPMTYLRDCPSRKYFRNEAAACGGVSKQNKCSCTGKATQNSYAMIRSIFGESDVAMPTLVVDSPSEGQKVQKGFPVRVTASDAVQLEAVELYIDNKFVSDLSTGPYVFNAPDVSDGIHIVEVRAINIYGKEAKQVVEVVQGSPCATAEECSETETCVEGRCVVGPGQDGGLGETCAEHEDCASLTCAGDGSGVKHCTEKCDPDKDGCPDGFSCVSAGESGVCWKSPVGAPTPSSSGGCNAGGSSVSLATFWLGLFALAFLVGPGQSLRRRGNRS